MFASIAKVALTSAVCTHLSAFKITPVYFILCSNKASPLLRMLLVQKLVTLSVLALMDALPVRLRRAAADAASGALNSLHVVSHFTKKHLSSNWNASSPLLSLQASSMHSVILDTSPRYRKSPRKIPLVIVTLYWIVSGLHWLEDPGIEKDRKLQTLKTCTIRNNKRSQGCGQRMRVEKHWERVVWHTKTQWKRIRKWLDLSRLSCIQPSGLGYFYFKVKNEYDSKCSFS